MRSGASGDNGMKHLFRIIFKAATALSLLLCVGTIALWVAAWNWPHIWVTELAEAPTPSMWRNESLEQATSLLVARGGLECRIYRMSGKPTGSLGPRTWNGSAVQTPQLPTEHLSRPSIWNRCGFLFESFTPGGSYFYSHGGRQARGYLLQVPIWSLLVLTGLLPFSWLARRWMARRRQKAGVCPLCGYDLRATPDRCPECGTNTTTPVRLSN